MLLFYFEKIAAAHNKYIKPIFTINSDFYIKLFVQVFDGEKKAENSMENFSHVSLLLD